MTPSILSEQEATAQGYLPLTSGYRTWEQPMLDAVLSDLMRGNVKYVLVTSAYQAAPALEVWRQPFFSKTISSHKQSQSVPQSVNGA